MLSTTLSINAATSILICLVAFFALIVAITYFIGSYVGYQQYKRAEWSRRLLLGKALRDAYLAGKRRVTDSPEQAITVFTSRILRFFK